MSYGDWAELGLTVLAAIAFGWLAWRRSRAIDHHFDMTIASRLLLIDGLLVVAGIEMVADSIHNLFEHGEQVSQGAEVIAVAARGAMIAGALALVASFREDYL